jgi:hypothetical protein
MAKPKYWTSDPEGLNLEFTDIDEAISNALDSMGVDERPDKLTLYGYVPITTNPYLDGLAAEVMNAAYEYLDNHCELGNPDGADHEKKELSAVNAAAFAFAKEVLVHYHVWRCEQVCQRQIDVKAWLAEHRKWENIDADYE